MSSLDDLIAQYTAAMNEATSNVSPAVQALKKQEDTDIANLKGMYEQYNIPGAGQMFSTIAKDIQPEYAGKLAEVYQTNAQNKLSNLSPLINYYSTKETNDMNMINNIASQYMSTGKYTYSDALAKAKTDYQNLQGTTSNLGAALSTTPATTPTYTPPKYSELNEQNISGFTGEELAKSYLSSKGYTNYNDYSGQALYDMVNKDLGKALINSDQDMSYFVKGYNNINLGKTNAADVQSVINMLTKDTTSNLEGTTFANYSKAATDYNQAIAEAIGLGVDRTAAINNPEKALTDQINFLNKVGFTGIAKQLTDVLASYRTYKSLEQTMKTQALKLNTATEFVNGKWLAPGVLKGLGV